MKDMDGENISGTYAYDPVHKTIKMTAGWWDREYACYLFE